ncbi:MAG: hypothetical protein M3063_05370 [Actinomycetota bacterium]|nr:hypothetical protein [Actinomycetota bacterium]
MDLGWHHPVHAIPHAVAAALHTSERAVPGPGPGPGDTDAGAVAGPSATGSDPSCAATAGPPRRSPLRLGQWR